jgi:hypothetical protein
MEYDRKQLSAQPRGRFGQPLSSTPVAAAKAKRKSRACNCRFLCIKEIGAIALLMKNITPFTFASLYALLDPECGDQ